MALKNGTGTVNGYKIGPEAQLAGANLEGADLAGADLEGANLERAKLTRANLRGANLHYANLRGALLFEANLRGANLYEATLSQAHLENAQLEHAILRIANLYGAELAGADLEFADLRGANLEGASLMGVNFLFTAVDPDHIPLIEADLNKMLTSLRVSGDRATGDRNANPALSAKSEQELLKILRKTRAVARKVQTRDGSYYDLDFNATLARALNDYEDATGKHPSKAVIARADRFFRIGEYDL